jgi:ABC-type uncharacterized transport system permease subunit
MSKINEGRTIGQYLASFENKIIEGLSNKKGYSIELATASVREAENMIAAFGFLAIAITTFPFNPIASVVAGIGFGGTFTQAINYTEQKIELKKQAKRNPTSR